ncbi:MAG TPA: PPC domain-containing DNA-binding protein [Bryobacteraceae bacterium]|nr:PPC domain-containing DNA-binding protein [Bryobacteraceae bacterium]
MRAKLLTGAPGEGTWVLIFDTGDEVVATLTKFAVEQKITAANFTAIGAFSNATLGYFDWESKKYEPVSVAEQAEVVTLLGDIALQDGKPKVHAHASLARRGGAMVGGHLLNAYVRPTLEVILAKSPRHLERQFDPASGIALIRP